MEQSKIDFGLLETFMAVAETGSFTRAAARMKRPKSRVSRHISQLEESLGLQLIYRTTRQVQLTEAGERLFRSSRIHMEGLENALSAASEKQNEMSGLIRMTAPDDLSTESLSGLIDEFLKAYPQIRFELIVTNTVVDLLDQKVDLALRVGRPLDSTFLIRRLGHLNSILVASPQLIKKHARPITLQSLPELPCLTFSLSEDFWTLKHVQQAKRRKVKISPIVRCTNHFMLRTLALQGQGIALLPAFLVRDYLASGELVRVLSQWTSEAIPVQILLPPQKNTTARVRRFADFLIDEMKSTLSASP